MKANKLKLASKINVISLACFLLLFVIQCSDSEHLSNTFVLDTSDSDSPPLSLVTAQQHKHGEASSSSHSSGGSSNVEAAHKEKALDESNTRIITDDQSSAAVNQRRQEQQSGRKLDDENVAESQLHGESRNKQHQASASSNQARRPVVGGQSTGRPASSSSSGSTTSAPPSHERDHNHHQNHQHNQHSNGAQAKQTEERLLISITSGADADDDAPTNYGDNKPHRNPQTSSAPLAASSSLGGVNDDAGLSGSSASTSHTLQQHQHQKRKPSITISIQDANINKQNSNSGGGGGGGGGTSAVIVRPGDDGHSIVIATVNSNSNSNANSNAYSNGVNSNKPHGQATSTLIGGGGGGIGQQESASQPYREPVNNPIQSILSQHQTSSSTRRPSYTGDYSSAGSSSTSINRPLPSSSSSSGQLDERPVRPIAIGSGEETQTSAYESSRPPQRPNEYAPEQGAASEQGAAAASKYELNERNCGIIQETKIVGGEEADPGDFMWMAAIVKSRPKDGQPRPFCGGSLITRRHILTAAHCLEGLAPRDVLVRLGSYDFEDSTASALSQDFAIDQFRVPAQYSKKTHAADIAIMRLKTPLMASDNYKTVCMAQPRRSYVGALGTVTGYGSQSQTFRRAAPKLRQVTVPIWENRKCSTVYKRNLTESFLCAGYEEGGKDACQGDSGGPLMTEGPEQRMMVVGVVSHGIGCGAPGYPGVYTRVTTFMDWIDKNTRE